MGNKANKNIANIVNNPPPKVIVGIDFGTSGVAYAFSFQNNQSQIYLSDFEGQSADKKVPTEIILDNDLKEILSFGHECSGYIMCHHDKNSYQYFKDIKMNLYKKLDKIKSTNGKEADIEIIISKILRKLSMEAISQIKNNHDDTITEKDIKWVVTIPAIWEEKSKKIMINASISAGLIDEDSDKSLFLALEPEVAGLFYFSSFASLNHKNINNGLPYVICDIGAGTVDICTHRKVINEGLTKPLNAHSNTNEIFDSELIEEYPPIGGDYGGDVINKKFIKRFIMELFGEERVNKLKNNPANEDWIEFEEKIEKLKRSFNNYETADHFLDCRLFEDKSINKNLDDYISEYNNKEHKYKYNITRKADKDWGLLFPINVFSDIIKKISKKIFIKLEEIYNNVHTGNVIFTGAGSRNYTICQYIEEFAKEKNLNIHISAAAQPEVSILKGAVLFGFNSNIIRKRKSKYTIGIKVHKDWNESKHKGKGEKIYNEIEKKDKCCNLFSKFITRNQYIEFDEVISKEYIAIEIKPSIIFYKTLKEDCTYIDEKDENNKLIIEKFGEVEFDIGHDFDINNRDVRIDMKLGGTYIYVSAVYLKNGKKLKTTQNFI